MDENDGGSSSIEITYCPWCGTELPLTSSQQSEKSPAMMAAGLFFF
ncbi:DUF6980 family protein [Peribacillus simplex]